MSVVAFSGIFFIEKTSGEETAPIQFTECVLGLDFTLRHLCLYRRIIFYRIFKVNLC